jgi:hypothetical protein
VRVEFVDLVYVAYLWLLLLLPPPLRPLPQLLSRLPPSPPLLLRLPLLECALCALLECVNTTRGAWIKLGVLPACCMELAVCLVQQLTAPLALHGTVGCR